MRKIIKFSGIDCPSCCMKVEKKLKKIKNINNLQLSFSTSKMLLDCEESNYEEVIQNIITEAKKIEKDANFEV